MSYTYSIIIPHKNIPLLLQRCLSSIPAMDDLQVIVVDDSSDSIDQVRLIVENYKNAELILTKAGKGAGHARNVGLQSAKGDWILFADADDYFEEGFLNVIKKHENDDTDIVYFSAKSVYSESLEPSPKLSKRKNVIARYMKNPRKMKDYLKYFQTEPWGKMIRRKLIEDKGIVFDETPLANDYSFSVVSGYYANNIIYDDTVIYVYTEREGSLSYELTADERSLKTRLMVYKNVQDFLDMHNIHYSPFYRYSFSEYLSKRSGYSTIVNSFWKEHNINKCYVFYRYFLAKTYQYLFGVNL